MATPKYLQKAVEVMKSKGVSTPTSKNVDLSQFSQPLPKQKGIGMQLLDFFSNAGNTAVAETLRGTGNITGTGLDLATMVANPIGYIQQKSIEKKTGIKQKTAGDYIKQGSEWAATQVETGSENLQKTGGHDTGESGKGTGKFLGAVAAQVPFLMAGGGALKSMAPSGMALRPTTEFALKSAGSTSIFTAESEGRLPTGKEIAGWGAVDLLFAGLGKTLYRSAFKGDKTTEMTLKKQFSQTMADIAEKLGYSGTSKQVEKQAIAAEKSIWKKLVDSAKTAKGAIRADFIKVADDIAKQFDQLPDSDYKKQVVQEVKDAVLSYAPKGKDVAKGEQIVATIGEINQNLFGQSGKSVLTPAKMTSLENDIKAGLKDLLPPEVKGHYKNYALNKQIELLMKNQQVKQAAMGALISGGSALGGSVALGADPMTTFKNTVISTILGAIGIKAKSSTLLKTTGGKFLKDTTFVKNLTQQVIDNLNKDQQVQIPETTTPETTQTESRPPLQNFVK